MLVLSRKQNQSVVFPRLGVVVEITRVAGKTVSVGVTAPKDIQILRGELLDAETGVSESTQLPETLSQHDLRNRLNKANLALTLLRKQIAAGRIEDADVSLATALGVLSDLDLESQSTGAEEVTRATGARRRRALLVEDDANERALLASYLRASGFDVDTAEDGVAALEYLAHQKPDAVVMDMQMPRLDGKQTVRRIRADYELDDVKLFIVSGKDRQAMNVPIGDRGVQRWFQKPLHPEDLVDELTASLK